MNNGLNSPGKVVKLILFPPHYVSIHSALDFDRTKVFKLLAANNLILDTGEGVLFTPPDDGDKYWNRSTEKSSNMFRWNGTLQDLREIVGEDKVIIRASSVMDVSISDLIDFAEENGHQVFYDDTRHTGFDETWFASL